MPIDIHPENFDPRQFHRSSPADRERAGGPSTPELFEFEIAHLAGAQELAAYTNCTLMEALVAILIERVEEVRREMAEPGHAVYSAAAAHAED